MVGGIRESAGLDLWRFGVLVGVKQGERVGDCKGVKRGVDGGVVRSVGLSATGKKKREKLAKVLHSLGKV